MAFGYSECRLSDSYRYYLPIYRHGHWQIGLTWRRQLNYRQIAKQLGFLVLLMGLFMATSLYWALVDINQEHAQKTIEGISISVVICFALCVPLLMWTRKSRAPIYRKEAIAIVALGYIVCGLLGSLPFILSDVLSQHYDNWFQICSAGIFESVSGLTTTGATVFVEIESLPRAILFWRSLSQWVGGMGILVLFLTILGQTGVPGKFLFSSEVIGPIDQSARPRVQKMAFLLLATYVVITVLQVVCMYWEGVHSGFDCFCYAFSTVSTGGFSILDNNVSQLQNIKAEITILVFMILAGINFNLHLALINRQWTRILRNRELLIYIMLMAVATIIIGIDLMCNCSGYSWALAIRHAGFQAVSIMTTTGYYNADVNSWTGFAKCLLVFLMFIGASSASIGGGIKVIRVMIFIKVIIHQIERTFRPNVIRPMRINGRAINDDIGRSVNFYVALVVTISFVATVVLLAVQNQSPLADSERLDISTAFTTVAATLNNVGNIAIQLSTIGDIGSFADFTAPAKLFLAALMILGRLEIMLILCLFAPTFWRRM